MSILQKSSVLVCSLFFLASCGQNLKYFTAGMQNEFNWSEHELSNIQFYVSEDIVLYKRQTGESARITDGKIRVEDDRNVEQIVIEKGTPGILVDSPKRDRFAVSFEGDDTKFLMFGPNKKAKGRYVLLAKEWARNYGKVSYGSDTYETNSSSAYAALMVDIKKARDTNYRTRKAEGKKVN